MEHSIYVAGPLVLGHTLLVTEQLGGRISCTECQYYFWVVYHNHRDTRPRAA